ncbi:hypothetical protein QFZ29_001748 [Agromyces albus]|nr:hypothetical protein [Agromyces albus]
MSLTRRGELERSGIRCRGEGDDAIGLGPRLDRPVDQLPPVIEHQSRAVGQHAHDVLGRACAEPRLRAHFPEPSVRPDTKWRWNAKNTIAVGSAATIAPEATTFHWLT